MSQDKPTPKPPPSGINTIHVREEPGKDGLHITIPYKVIGMAMVSIFGVTAGSSFLGDRFGDAADSSDAQILNQLYENKNKIEDNGDEIEQHTELLSEHFNDHDSAGYVTRARRDKVDEQIEQMQRVQIQHSIRQEQQTKLLTDILEKVGENNE